MCRPVERRRSYLTLRIEKQQCGLIESDADDGRCRVVLAGVGLST
jgi:hypothetical protein